MHASHTLTLKLLLSALVIAVVLAVPNAFAKKDLFATEPSAKNTPATQQLVPAGSATSEDTKTDTNTHSETTKSNDTALTSVQTPKAEAKKEVPENPKEFSDHKDPSQQKKAPDTKEPSTLEVQLARLKRNLTKTKNNLFGDKESSDKKTVAAPAIEPQMIENASTEEEIKPEMPTISSTEAALRAQTFAEGQVINVRKYYEEDKPRYAVKLLQKNGRMKTINLDAVNGTPIEEKPSEEAPQ